MGEQWGQAGRIILCAQERTKHLWKAQITSMVHSTPVEHLFVLSLCNTEVCWFPSHLHKLSSVSSFYFSFPYKRSLPKSMLLAGFWVCVYVYFNSLSYFTCKTLIITAVEIISWIPNLYFSFGKSPWIIHDFSVSLIF